MNPDETEPVTGSASRDRIHEELTLAREVGRGIAPPVFEGVTVELQGHRVNLWWSDGLASSRTFSDAFITQQDRLVIVAADVLEMTDASGLAVSVRAFLRARLGLFGELGDVLEDLDSWLKQDPQWNGFLQLGVGVFHENRELQFVRRGAIRVVYTDRHGRATEIDSPDSLPLGVGAKTEDTRQTSRAISLKTGETIMMVADSDAKEESADAGRTCRLASVAVMAT